MHCWQTWTCEAVNKSYALLLTMAHLACTCVTHNTVDELPSACSLPNIVVCYAADSCLNGGDVQLFLLDHGA